MPSSGVAVPLGTTLARGLGPIESVRWPLVRASEIFELRYGKALVESARRDGNVPVYGTNGRTGWHDEALFSGPGIVIGRKGAGHLGVEWTPQPFWVIDTAYALRSISGIDLKFAYYLIRYVGLDHLKHGTSNPSLTRDAFGAQLYPIPPLDEQRAIAATLTSLDDKIDSHLRARAILRDLGCALFGRALRVQGGTQVELATLVLSIFRGVAPKYSDADPSAPLVLNQKCIRDGRVSLGPARRMVDRKVAVGRRASSGDILVNSTGTGTLGRVGRWHEGDIFVDGHVSVVKPNRMVIGPTALAYALFGREADIEDLATGSTGQTELSPSRLGSLLVGLPAPQVRDALELELLAIEEKSEQLSQECERLAALRDALLPELVSGRTRVREAPEALVGAVA